VDCYFVTAYCVRTSLRTAYWPRTTYCAPSCFRWWSP